MLVGQPASQLATVLATTTQYLQRGSACFPLLRHRLAHILRALGLRHLGLIAEVLDNVVVVPVAGVASMAVALLPADEALVVPNLVVGCMIC